MTKFAFIALLLALSVPAFADATAPTNTTPAPAAEKTAYVCWYGTNGQLTSAQPSSKGAPRSFVVTGHGGDKTYAYGVYSTDGKDCPDHVRH